MRSWQWLRFVLLLIPACSAPCLAHIVPCEADAAREPAHKAEAAVIPSGEGRVISIAGDKARVVFDGSRSQDRFALFDYVTPPGGGPPPHVHSLEDESFYILEGQFSFHLNGNSISAGPGAFLFSPKGSSHYFVNTGKTPGRMLIWVTPAGLEKFFDEVGSGLPDLEAPPAPFTPEAGARLTAMAPKYGLEIKIPEQAK